ncbi:hypothetical protein D3C86_1597690 [compost metagenome]
MDLETRLVKLARSAARLERVNDIARAEIGRQNERRLLETSLLPPDDVEVHLAYETGLAKRLDLPWQSEAMLYQTRADVDTAKINTAYDTIISLEEGDGLVNVMIDLFENPFWDNHLRRTHPAGFEANDNLFEMRQNLVEDLRLAQEGLANIQDEAELASRQNALKELARQLNLPENEVLTEQLYDRLLSDISHERNALARKLTREAMTRAGI